MSDTRQPSARQRPDRVRGRERCVECGHFICPDTAPSPPAPGEVGNLIERLRGRASSYREGGPSSEHTAAMLDEAADALASAHRRAEEAESIALANEEAGRAAVAGGIAQMERVASLTSRLEAAERERDEAHEKADAHELKFRSLSALEHVTCGCSYDRTADICSHHSPKLVAAEAARDAATAERDEARAKYQELIRSANGYGPALAQQDRRIEELESKCERLIFSCERTESERDEARQAAEVEANERRRSHARIAELEAILTPAPSKEGDGE